MAQEHFDIAIIGGGPGGYSTALRAAELGKSVVLIERDATLGGTCLNRGCIPSKTLLTATHAVENMRHAKAMGINVSVESIDFGKLRTFRTQTVDTMTKGLAGLLAHRGVTIVRGEAVMQPCGSVHVTPVEGLGHILRFVKAGVGEPIDGELEIVAEDIVIATGSRPSPLPDNPFAGALIDSTQALELDTFPSSAVIIGAAVSYTHLTLPTICSV